MAKAFVDWIRKVPGDDPWNVEGVVGGKTYQTSSAVLIAIQSEPTLIPRGPHYAILLIKRLYQGSRGDFFVLSQWWDIIRERRITKEIFTEYTIEPYTLHRAISFYRYHKGVVRYEDVFPSFNELYRKYLKVSEVMKALNLSEAATRKLLIDAGAKLSNQNNNPNEMVHSSFVTILLNKFLRTPEGSALGELLNQSPQ